METFTIIGTAFIGAVVGWFGSRSLDRKRWLREQRLDVYLDVPKTIEAFILRAYMVRVPGTDRSELMGPLGDVRRAITRVRLIGSPDLQPLGDKLTDATRRHFGAALKAPPLAGPGAPSVGDDDLQPTEKQLTDALAAFVTAARRDLGLDTKAR